LILPYDPNDPTKEAEYKVSSQDGSMAFTAPEQFSDFDFLAKPLDVWAFGITIFLYWNDNLPKAYAN
jgi:serine/threonine protein kinase